MATLKAIYTPPLYNSDSNVWISWYDQLESSFGKKDAFAAFSRRWALLNAAKSPANTSSFREAMKGKGISIEPSGVAGSLLDKATSISDSIGGFLKVGGSVVFVMQVVTFIVILAIVWKLAKPEAVGTVIKYAK